MDLWNKLSGSGGKITQKPSREAVFCPLCEKRMPEICERIYHCVDCDITYDGMFGIYVVSNPGTIANCQRAGYRIVEKVLTSPPAIKIIDCL